MVLKVASLQTCRVEHPDLAQKATWDDVFIDELRRTFKSLYCILLVSYLLAVLLSNDKQHGFHDSHSTLLLEVLF